ncbi:MAG: DUF4396 domain-containing protein [Waddliaceae bacterium]
MIDGVLLLWFLLTLGSLLFVLWDQFTNTPSLRVMTLAWALIILYTGPLGLFIYFLSCRQPMPGTHDQFIQVHWKQAIGSLIHCVAGDATAIIIMAAILSYYALPNGVEVIVEYCVAYLFGLLIFQALFMRSMFDSYLLAVQKTVFAETVSMNMVMAGMFPVMVIVRHFYPIAGDPFLPYFWGMMSLATITASITAYPINSWLVKKKVKHGMMSRRMIPMEHAEHMKHQEHMSLQEQGHKKNMRHHEKPGSLPLETQWAMVIGTFFIFIGVMAIVGMFVPIRFR